MGQTTLSKFLILHLQKNASEPELAALLVDVAAAVKKITAMISKGSAIRVFGTRSSPTNEATTWCMRRLGRTSWIWLK